MNRKNQENFEKNRDFSSSKLQILEKDPEFLSLKKLFYDVKKELKLTDIELLNKELIEKEILIPITIFSKKISSLEAVVKYLKENLELSHKEISKLLNRNYKTVYQAYVNASKKVKEKIGIKESKYYVPVSILTDRKLGVLESIVKFLHENHKLNFSEISRLLGRDPRTIWTVYTRGRKKNEK